VRDADPLTSELVCMNAARCAGRTAVASEPEHRSEQFVVTCARKCARKSPRIAHELPSDEQPIMRAGMKSLQMGTIFRVR
jgi:hypothetical protein